MKVGEGGERESGRGRGEEEEGRRESGSKEMQLVVTVRRTYLYLQEVLRRAIDLLEALLARFGHSLHGCGWGVAYRPCGLADNRNSVCSDVGNRIRDLCLFSSTLKESRCTGTDERDVGRVRERKLPRSGLRYEAQRNHEDAHGSPGITDSRWRGCTAINLNQGNPYLPAAAFLKNPIPANQIHTCSMCNKTSKSAPSRIPKQSRGTARTSGQPA